MPKRPARTRHLRNRPVFAPSSSISFSYCRGEYGSAVFAIESQIVGYAENENALNPNAGTLVSSQFGVVGNDSSFKMGDLLPFTKIAGADSLEYNVEAQIQNYDGTCDDANDLWWNGTNWEDVNGNDVTDRTIDAGTGFKIFLSTDECYLKSSGQVSTSPSTIPLADNAGTNVGNPFPVDILFGTITVSGDTDGYNVEAQIQNYDGTCDDENDLWWNGSNWENVNGDDMTERHFTKGTGVRVFLSKADVSLYIPVPDALKNN